MDIFSDQFAGYLRQMAHGAVITIELFTSGRSQSERQPANVRIGKTSKMAEMLARQPDLLFGLADSVT